MWAVRRALSLAVGIAFVSVVTAPAGLADAVPSSAVAVADPVPALQHEPLVLELTLGNTPLDAVLSVYESGPRVLVPLGELCSLLDIGIQVDLPLGTADGFFVSEARRFHLDTHAHTIKCGKVAFAWDGAGIVIQSGDIYVANDLLSAWLGLDLIPHRQAATLEVRSETPLPIQLRAERARRIQKTLAGGDAPAPNLPRARTPYRPWSMPAIDQQVMAWSSGGHSRRRTEWQSTTYAAADLLYLESDVYVRGTGSNPLSQVRGGAGRRDPDPVLLGPLHARQFRVGEVGDPGLPLVTMSHVAPGLMVSNYPLEHPSQFREQTFRGRLPDGWDVELYRDGGLIAYRESREDGAYEFTQVPLIFGLNEFLLVFNGPHGEHRVERAVYNIGPSLTPPGAPHYRLVASGLTDSTLRAHLETDFHLAGSVSGSAGLATVREAGRARQFAATGVRGFWRSLFAGADVAADAGGGRVMEFGLSARAPRVAASLRHDRLSSAFRSEVLRSSYGTILTRTSALLDGRLLPGRRSQLPMSFELTQDRLGGDRSVLTWLHRMSVSVRGMSLSHELRRTRGFGNGMSFAPDMREDMLLGGRVRNWSLRGGIEAAPGTPQVWRDAELTAEGPVFGSLDATLGITHDWLNANSIASADLRADRGLFGWTARVEMGTRSPLSMSLALSMGLSREPRHGDWYVSAQPATSTGTASAQVFLDTNDNGRRDAGEEPLPGVGLSVGQGRMNGKTDERGVLFVTGLPGEQEVELMLVPTSLEDPLWVPRDPALRVLARPGATALLDFPVVVSGEVAGTVSVNGPSGKQPAAGITLELVDPESGRVAQRIVTAYDGYFDMLTIPPGRYQLRIAASSLRRFGLGESPSRAIVIEPTGTLLENVDFLIEPAPAPTRAEGR